MSTEMNNFEKTKFRTDDQNNVSILNTIYEVMTSISQELRKTTELLTVWGGSIILLFVGWIVTGDKEYEPINKVYLSFAVFLIGSIFIWIINSHKKRYVLVAKVIRNINEIQLVYKEGFYLEYQTLFPAEMKSYGTSQWKEPIFTISFISLPTITLFGIISLWIL